MACTLTRNSWLYRSWEVVTSEGWFQVEYDGRGMGFECVRVQGEAVVSTRSRWWFVPRFDFRVGSLPAFLEVRVWPWLSLRSVRLNIDGHTVYDEALAAARQNNRR
jgi:hypothetical protein